MLIPAADLVCRKKRILSTPDHTRHQTPRSVEFLNIRSSLAVSTASCRHAIQLLSGFGEVATCRKHTAYKIAWPSLENGVEVLRSTKTRHSLRYHRSVQTNAQKQRPPLHSICCSARRALASLRVWQYVCLRGETWLPSSMLQSCSTLICRFHVLRKFAQLFILSVEVPLHSIQLPIEVFFQYSI